MAEFRPVNLAEIYGQIDAAKANQASMQNNAMMQERQRRQFALEDEELNKKRRMSEAYKNSIDVVDGAPVLNRKKLSQFLLQEDPTAALEVEDKFAQIDATKAKTKSESAKAELENRKATAAYLRDRLAGVQDQATYDAVMSEAAELGAGFIKGAPREFNPEFVRNQLFTADEFLKQSTPKYEKVDLGGKIQIIDVNPMTNPSIKGTSLDKTATIGERETMRHNRVQEGVSGAQLGLQRERLAFDKAGGVTAVNAKSKDAPAVNQGSIDAIDQAKSSLQTIIDHPGRKAATGKSAILNRFTLPGTDRAGFQARLETFKAQTFVPMVAQLKGMGALSDAEGKKLTAAVGALDPNMPEDEFLASANEIMNELELKKKRALGDTSSTIMRKGEKMPVDVRSEADKILGL